MNAKERIGLPKSTAFKWRKELLSAPQPRSCSHRGRIVFELGRLEALEVLLARDIAGKLDLSEREWQAVFAACNGNAMFWPQTVEGFFEGGRETVDLHVPSRPLSWQFREWCRYSYAEASQFGDPNALYHETGAKLDRLTDAEQFFLMGVMAELWNGAEGCDAANILEFLAKKGLVAKE